MDRWGRVPSTLSRESHRRPETCLSCVTRYNPFSIDFRGVSGGLGDDLGGSLPAIVIKGRGFIQNQPIISQKTSHVQFVFQDCWSDVRRCRLILFDHRFAMVKVGLRVAIYLLACSRRPVQWQAIVLLSRSTFLERALSSLVSGDFRIFKKMAS